MEPLSRRAYNRTLWRRAAAGMTWNVHLASAVASAVPVAVRHLMVGQPFESEWPLNVGLALVTFIFIELAWICFRRCAAAPHELYLDHLREHVDRAPEIAALREQLRKLPAPRLVLTYAVESLKGFEDEVSNPPIRVHNEGETAAIDAQIDALQLSPLITVKFSTVQRIAAQDTAVFAPRVEIRTESGGWELDHNQAHFGLAIQRAHVELAHRNVKTDRGSRRWTLTLRYYDAAGAAYTQDYNLMLDVPTMRAWTAYVAPSHVVSV